MQPPHPTPSPQPPGHPSPEAAELRLTAAVTATLAQLLVEAAIQSPESDAVTGTFGSLSYADLLIRAQNIAVTLRRQGIAPGALVGVAMEQSPVTITSIVGILLAGAAYVPLGADLLADRQALQRIRSAGMALILCDSSHGTNCTLWKDLGNVLDAARMEQDTMPASSDTLLPRVSIDSPAVVLFRRTSGEPTAGVMLSHRAITRIVFSADLLKVGMGEIFLLHPASGARAGLLELWGSLLHGATLALALDGSPTLDGIAASIRRHGVRTLCLPVTTLHDLIDHAPQIFSYLHTLIIEQDRQDRAHPSALSPQRLQKLVNNYPRLRVVHSYGTVETAGYATSYVIPADYVAEASVPVGLPIAGTRALLLDRSHQPVRPGEIGEAAFTGDAVALGYYQDPEATAARFIPVDASGSPAFLTGERARFRSDALLELHGHLERPIATVEPESEPGIVDIKPYGPADIEAMLMSQLHVRDASVLQQTDHNGKRRNIAYLAMESVQPALRADLEDSMRKVLPPDALPTAYHYFESIPRDAQGNVDRVQLQQRLKRLTERSHIDEGVRQDILDQVRSVWSRLFQYVPGYDEDFFEAGGTQVQMIRLHVELNRRFPGAITMANLSVLTTIRKIYEHLISRDVQATMQKLQRGA